MELAEIWRNELHRMALWLQQGGILEPLPSEEFRGRMNLNMYVQLGRKDISDGCFAMRLGLAGLFWSLIEVDDFSLRVIHSLVHDLAAPLAPHEVVEVASSKNPLKVLCPSASQIVID